MLKILMLLTVVLLAGQSLAACEDDIAVVPRPAKMTRGEGRFMLTPDTRIQVEKGASPRIREVGQYLADLVAPATGFCLEVEETTADRPAGGAILLLTRGADPLLGDEGYALRVEPAGVVIRAPKPAGLFYGVQTLRQLFPPEIESRQKVSGVEWAAPAVILEDRPRFQWRGLHLDEGRHFQGKAFVLRYLDQMALHKLNRFHWHLTEDQGWRIEIKKYPRLTEVGSKRSQTPILDNRKKGDGKAYGPFFYTQEDVKEIVAYARSRFITVVPEIEMPGHAQAAIAAYPWLGNTDEPLQVRWRWGVSKNVYNVEDRTFEFLEHVLTEVMTLFPGPFIHIGGDECPKDQWKASPAAQKRIREEGLENEHELQSWFIRRIDRFLQAKGRRLIGWDEILEGGLAEGAAVMSWRGTKGGIAAARAGHDVVMSPTSHCYFDYYQSRDRKKEPPAIGGFLPLEKVYAFEPVPAALNAKEARHVLGAQGNVWTEYIPDGKQVEYMAWPRGSALSEVVWSPKALRDYGDFQKRLGPLLRRMDVLGVNYRKP